MSDERKTLIRARARARRRERRSREEAAKTPFDPAPGESFDAPSGVSFAIRPEGPALLKAWRGLLEVLGVSASGLLPALFLPTPMEPDIRLLFATSSRCLLPALVDEEGAPLKGPAWAQWDTARRGEPPGPHEVLGPPLGPEALARAGLIVLPALAVDAAGTRIGQGGGWYDRALLHARPGAPIVAVVFDDERSPAPLPRRPHDVPVDAVLSPGGFTLIAGAGSGPG